MNFRTFNAVREIASFQDITALLDERGCKLAKISISNLGDLYYLTRPTAGTYAKRWHYKLLELGVACLRAKDFNLSNVYSLRENYVREVVVFAPSNYASSCDDNIYVVKLSIEAELEFEVLSQYHAAKSADRYSNSWTICLETEPGTLSPDEKVDLVKLAVPGGLRSVNAIGILYELGLKVSDVKIPHYHSDPYLRGFPIDCIAAVEGKITDEDSKRILDNEHDGLVFGVRYRESLDQTWLVLGHTESNFRNALYGLKEPNLLVDLN